MMHRGVDEDVRIVWRRNGEQRRRSVFQVASSPTQQAFRATLSLTNDDIGSWSVQLVGPKGQLLVSRMFEVEP